MRLLLRPSTRAYRGLLASAFGLPWLVEGYGGSRGDMYLEFSGNDYFSTRKGTIAAGF